jgi:hypothetical protein
MRPSKGLKVTPVVMPTAMSSGAVSPMTRAIARVIPDAMPPTDVGRTTLRIVRHFGTPRAYAASRSSFGTILSISSDARTTTRIMRTDNATAPAKPSRTPGPKKIANRAKANRPATIDGMPVMTSTKNVIARASLPLPYSTR